MSSRPRRSRPTTDDQQLALPFNGPTPAVVNILRVLPQEATQTTSPTLFEQWRQLAIAVVYTGGRPTSWQQLAAAASKFKPGLIGTKSDKTFKRAHAEAVRHGVIVYTRTAKGTVRVVDAKRVSKLAQNFQERAALDRERVRDKTRSAVGDKIVPETPENCPRDAAELSPRDPEFVPGTTCAFELHSEASRSKGADGDNFGPELKTAIADWLAYKAERRQAFTPTSLRKFHALIARRVAEFGQAAVVASLDRAMASGYGSWDFGFTARATNPDDPRGNIALAERLIAEARGERDAE